MSTTYTFGYTWASGAAARSQTLSLSDSASLTIDEAVTASTTDQLIACTISTAAISGLWIESDQAVTVETNNSTTPVDTIALLANQPLVWQENDYYSLPLTADVTALYVTNAGASSANVKFRFLFDSTP
jgi:hypothetical protein